ncbi:hypothetical protein TNCV_4048471 [Trichonephila clavipes]|nr:hypothetical protein TNCV_4048471 [Trichonephila clavipes]
MIIQGRINSKQVEVLLDTGSSGNIIPKIYITNQGMWRISKHKLPPSMDKLSVRNSCLHLATGRTRDDREKDLATTERKKVGTGEKREGDEKSRGREK